MVIYVTEQGINISFSENRLVFKRKGLVIKEIPIKLVTQIVLFGNIQITTQVIRNCLLLGIDIVYLSYNGEFLGRLSYPLESKNSLRLKQYAIVSNPSASIKFARKIVETKILNMKNKLQRLSRDYPSHQIDESVQKLKNLLALLSKIKEKQRITGFEGIATRTYFSEIKKVLPTYMNFKSRNRRPALDPVNSLLNLSNTLILNKVWSSIERVGLDPYHGFFHSDRAGRPSLVLDVMEQFRASISESFVWNICNRKQFKPEDFITMDNGAVLLNEEGRKRFYTLFEQRMQELILHPILNRKMTFMECIHVQSELLAKAIRENGEYKGFVWRF